MTRYLLEFPLGQDEGKTIIVEVDEPEAIAGPERAARWAGRKKLEPEEAGETFEHALERITPAATALVARLKGVAADDYTVEFGIKLSGTAGVVIASASTEAHFTVRLGWHADHTPGDE